jgi:hypothetical protein
MIQHINFLFGETKTEKKETVICCRELQAMLTRGGGQATSEQSNLNGSSKTFMVIISVYSCLVMLVIGLMSLL